jgi:hypothetical protein
LPRFVSALRASLRGYPQQPPYPQQPYVDPQQAYAQQPYPQQYVDPQQAYAQQPYPQQQGYTAQPQPQSGYPEPTTGQPQEQNPAMAQPGTAAGGISFDITPATAAVIIDGTYVGRVSDLGPTTQPMGLKPGRHHVEIRSPGYESVTFDADIVSTGSAPTKGDGEAPSVNLARRQATAIRLESRLPSPSSISSPRAATGSSPSSSRSKAWACRCRARRVS